ncbi:hypothetical protein ACFYOK_10860 [Microbispora bryophytorum]|uniref:hypothetical protein n=1 Tax=Microbispora bryophytorum TaxID=1460882 RepID=UPI0033D29895
MNGQRCEVFPWCEGAAGHGDDTHTRVVYRADSRGGALNAHVILAAGDRRSVLVEIVDDWTGTPTHGTFRLAPDMAQALGALLLTLPADETLKLGEALLRAGHTLGDSDE